MTRKILLVISGVQALQFFSTCRSNDKLQRCCVNVAFLCNFCTCRSNGKLQMRRVHVAVRSIVTMLSFELILFHGINFYKLILWARYESCGIMAGPSGKA